MRCRINFCVMEKCGIIRLRRSQSQQYKDTKQDIQPITTGALIINWLGLTHTMTTKVNTIGALIINWLCLANTTTTKEVTFIRSFIITLFYTGISYFNDYCYYYTVLLHILMIHSAQHDMETFYVLNHCQVKSMFYSKILVDEIWQNEKYYI